MLSNVRSDHIFVAFVTFSFVVLRAIEANWLRCRLVVWTPAMNWLSASMLLRDIALDSLQRVIRSERCVALALAIHSRKSRGRALLGHLALERDGLFLGSKFMRSRQ